MKLFDKIKSFMKEANINLSESDFKLEKSINNIEMEVTPTFLELLKKDGYAKNFLAGKSSSIIETKKLTTPIKLWKQRITLNYHKEDSILNKELPIINEKLNWILNNKGFIENKISKELLSLKNESWLSENEDKMTETEFVKNLTINQLDYYEENQISLIFNENGMFYNHKIEISLLNSNKLGISGLIG